MRTGDEYVLKSGRRVAVRTVVDGTGDLTIVICHPAPGSSAFDPEPEQTFARGVTLLAVDRPGYGGSEPMPDDQWTSVSCAADDLAQVLDHRQTGPVGLAGWSAGGRVAMALAAHRPDLVERLAVIATPAPDEEVPWIPPEQRAALDALRGRPPGEVYAELADQLRPLLPADPHAPRSLAALGAGPADAEALSGGGRDRLGRMLAAAYAQGVTGLAADIAGYCLQPWGFEPAGVQTKTLLLYGSQDPVAGSRHGRWWLEHLPDARLEMVPGAGHLLMIPLWKRVLSHLAPHCTR
jgi:pimeloyl-ACP methyl ester carboxylesterase